MHYNRNVDSDLVKRMQESLPAQEWALLQRVAQTAGELGMPLYVVGGLPRDLLLGRPGTDLDLVVEGKAEKLARALATKHGGRVVIHGSFGTAKWETGSRRGGHGAAELMPALDLITARAESYRHPAALPTVKAGTVGDDLQRRDFTINAIAIRLDDGHMGELRDELGGQEDLRQGMIRVLHPGSFSDDPTRMYRAVRYEQRYGFRIADETLALIPEGRRLVEKLSQQRIRHELDLILDEPRAAAMLSRLAELDLLKPVDAALFYDNGVAARLEAEQAEGQAPLEGSRRDLRWVLWLMPLPEHQIHSIQRRLHFTAALLKALVAASELWAGVVSLEGKPPSAWVERLQDIPLTAAQAVRLGLEPGPVRSALGRYLDEWRHVRPVTTGHDLKEMGLQPGADFKRILSELRRARLDGEIETDEEERQHLRALLERGARRAGE